MQLRGNWNYPTTVRFGAGRIAELPEALRLAGIRKPLFVTDPMLAKMPMTAQAIDLLASAGVHAKLFSDVQPIRSKPTSRPGWPRTKPGAMTA